MSQRKPEPSNTRLSSSIEARGNGSSASSSTTHKQCPKVSPKLDDNLNIAADVEVRIDKGKVNPKPDPNLNSVLDGKTYLKKTPTGKQDKVNLSFVANAKAKLDKENKISDKRDNLTLIVDAKVSIDQEKVKTPSGAQDPGRLKSVVESPKKAAESSKKTGISTHRQPTSTAGSSQKDHERSEINKPKRS